MSFDDHRTVPYLLGLRLALGHSLESLMLFRHGAIKLPEMSEVLLGLVEDLGMDLDPQSPSFLGGWGRSSGQTELLDVALEASGLSGQDDRHDLERWVWELKADVWATALGHVTKDDLAGIDISSRLERLHEVVARRRAVAHC